MIEGSFHRIEFQIEMKTSVTDPVKGSYKKYKNKKLSLNI